MRVMLKQNGMSMVWYLPYGVRRDNDDLRDNASAIMVTSPPTQIGPWVHWAMANILAIINDAPTMGLDWKT